MANVPSTLFSLKYFAMLVSSRVLFGEQDTAKTNNNKTTTCTRIVKIFAKVASNFYDERTFTFLASGDQYLICTIAHGAGDSKLPHFPAAFKSRFTIAAVMNAAIHPRQRCFQCHFMKDITSVW